MNKILIDLIVGTRPNLVKISPIIRSINEFNKKNNKKKILTRLIHTGQHYDHDMSGSFFKQLKIPRPNYNLNVSEKMQSYQVGKIMMRYEDILSKKKPNLCLVVGDVNSTLACTITAKKKLIDVAHVESGLRSNDFTMPEEINRRLTDSITDFHFTTSENASFNLLKEGVKKKSIFFVGNTMIDSLKNNLIKIKPTKILDKFDITKNNYFVLTLHRPGNVDNQEKFFENIKMIESSLKNKKILFPLHPRIEKYKDKLKFKNFIFTSPLPYLDFLQLVNHSQGVITDSGGLSEETTYLNVPCITIRKNTERPETIELGTNILTNESKSKFNIQIKRILDNKWKNSTIPKKWDGKSSIRIIDTISRIYL